jgi:hypothetical protein
MPQMSRLQRFVLSQLSHCVCLSSFYRQRYSCRVFAFVSLEACGFFNSSKSLRIHAIRSCRPNGERSCQPEPGNISIHHDEGVEIQCYPKLCFKCRELSQANRASHSSEFIKRNCSSSSCATDLLSSASATERWRSAGSGGLGNCVK